MKAAAPGDTALYIEFPAKYSCRHLVGFVYYYKIPVSDPQFVLEVIAPRQLI